MLDLALDLAQELGDRECLAKLVEAARVQGVLARSSESREAPGTYVGGTGVSTV